MCTKLSLTTKQIDRLVTNAYINYAKMEGAAVHCDRHEKYNAKPMSEETKELYAKANVWLTLANFIEHNAKPTEDRLPWLSATLFQFDPKVMSNATAVTPFTTSIPKIPKPIQNTLPK